VNGLDTNAGTQAAPVRTVSHAATLNKEQVYLATGTFPAASLHPGRGVYAGTTRQRLGAHDGQIAPDGLAHRQPGGCGPRGARAPRGAGPAAAAGRASAAVALFNASSPRASQLPPRRGTGANGSDGTAAPPSARVARAARGSRVTRPGRRGRRLRRRGHLARVSPAEQPRRRRGHRGRGRDARRVGALATECDGGVFDGIDGGDALAARGGAVELAAGGSTRGTLAP